jgi:hypothetical protein
VVFNVNLIAEILWQEDAFDNLVLPDSQKSLIKALVESHSGPEEDGFDDFIMGKGRGLIINLFGPPGVGKTLSAEATSECKVSSYPLISSVNYFYQTSDALCMWSASERLGQFMSYRYCHHTDLSQVAMLKAN